MPLGDSITYGVGSGGTDLEEFITGYRQPLYLSLINAGYYVDFFGSLHTGQSATPLFDYDHEGHPGWHAKGGIGGGLAPNIFNWLSLNPADIVLLHIGTNDISDGDQNVDEVAEILDNIDLFSGDTTVILARIINRKTYSATTTDFNNSVEAMAEDRIANGDKIIIVDQEDALNYGTDMADNLHPNDSGYSKMAAIWFNALETILPVCEQIPPSIISSTAGSGGSITPSGAVPVHYGLDQAFNITASTGYHIEDVIVDGNSVGAITSYIFPGVTSNHTIEATFVMDNPPQEIIIDDGDPSTSYTGNWYISSGSNPYGTDSIYSSDGATYTWTFTAQQTGNYELSMWWTYRPTRSSNVPVDIEYYGGTARVYINQQQNGGQWNVLGSYSFEEGKSYKITITAQGSATTCADAVRFVYVSGGGGTLPPIAVIDNGDPGTSSTGIWDVSSGTNPYDTNSLYSSDGATYTWTFTPSQTGDYEVSMWWTYRPTRSSNVPVDIQNAGGTDRVYINQLQNGGQWNVLGTYPFTAGVSYNVTVTAQGSATTCADAVRFVFLQ
jgi:lysophospholipase L1-like esterase